ncbi:hypothetical protein M0R04_02095 [Candidatus Dojkabacteria bacterium]|jgi:hypothetical protein|nr:hypothetical protein [Candidatus Dojkabacteria bacterium]
MDRGNSPKIHPMIFLILMVLVSVISTVVFKKFNVVTTTPTQTTTSVASTKMEVFYNDTKADVAKTTIDSSSSVVIYENGKTNQSVLGCVDGSGDCSFNSQTPSQPVCISQDTSIKLAKGGISDGTTVRKNAVIKPYKITAPIGLLSGSKYPENSSLEITQEFPTFRSAGDLITKDQLLSHCILGVNCDEYEKITKSSAKGPFSINVRAQKVGVDAPNSKATISQKLASAFPKLQPAETNPDTTNKAAGALSLLFQTPGSQVTSRNFGTTKCIEVNSSGINLTGSENFQSCLSSVKPASFLAKAAIGIERWLQCLKDKTGCEKTELIGIQIDAIFGSSTECKTGSCASMYFDATVASSTIPGEAAKLVPTEIDQSKLSANQAVIQPFYVTTPCEVLVDGDVVKTSCLWDVSPYKRIYDKERANKMPNDPNFPKTFQQYWSMVEAEVEARSNSCI